MREVSFARSASLAIARAVVAVALAIAARAPAQERESEGAPKSAEQPAPPRDLRERLTEREDENRVENPWTFVLFGNPLTASGEYEIELEATDPVLPGVDPAGDDRLLLENQLEVELFYSLGEPLAFFVQGSLHWDRDLAPETSHGADDWYVERGEMWVFAEDLFGSGVDLDVGHLDFEDDRLWWWDVELDAARLEWEGGPDDALGASLAAGWELAPERSDQSALPADEEDHLRVLAELSWELAPSHGLELFGLFDDDRSDHPPLGASVRVSDVDEEDAHLFWVGPRALGAFESGSRWILGYWADGGIVGGRETFIEHGEPEAGRQPVEAVERRDVSGWALDLAITVVAPAAFEPRVTLGYAIGSGDDERGERDRSYRQSGLHENETGFGGVRRFTYYGRLLAPELSNLAISTAGAGISLFSASSLDLVYHHYRLVERADSLRAARLETEFDGRHRDVGHGLDLVLAIEEGERFEIEISGSMFRSGRAWGARSGEWAFGGQVALRIALF